MPRRFLLTALQAILTLVLSVLGAGLLQWFFGASPAEALLDQGPRLILTFMDVGVIAWLLLLILGAARGAGLGFGMLGTVLAALISAALNLVVVVIVALVQGGAGIFAIALGVEAGIIFIVAALLVALVMYRLVKPSKPIAPAT
ncbi:hypothetical protein PYV02_04925 [Leifsonia sp. H3M29-4]|uniref:hypothetical protein n=1 Tax=Salinibacterium metalliresistens TaxID=3031321 RepID=UPI0023DB64F6|nr:hypothetical protein [Salinibacterium metalliresistens]MDF1478422.1 hypothetical protein [Salinibacterium metalliresistens]